MFCFFETDKVPVLPQIFVQSQYQKLNITGAHSFLLASFIPVEYSFHSFASQQAREVKHALFCKKEQKNNSCVIRVTLEVFGVWFLWLHSIFR